MDDLDDFIIQKASNSLDDYLSSKKLGMIWMIISSNQKWFDGTQWIHQTEGMKMAYNTKKHTIGFKRHEEASDRSENMRNRKFMNFRISYVSQKNFQIDLIFFSIILKKNLKIFKKIQNFAYLAKLKKQLFF